MSYRVQALLGESPTRGMHRTRHRRLHLSTPMSRVEETAHISWQYQEPSCEDCPMWAASGHLAISSFGHVGKADFYPEPAKTVQDATSAMNKQIGGMDRSLCETETKG